MSTIMNIGLANIGLAIVCIAWIYQFIRSARIDKSFRPAFIIYSLGLLLIVIDNFMNRQFPQAYLPLIAFLAVLLALFISYKKKK